jgi:hypothetical protein
VDSRKVFQEIKMQGKGYMDQKTQVSFVEYIPVPEKAAKLDNEMLMQD